MSRAKLILEQLGAMPESIKKSHHIQKEKNWLLVAITKEGKKVSDKLLPSLLPKLKSYPDISTLMITNLKK
jgi:hypothetical protein